LTQTATRELAQHWRTLLGCTIAASIGTIGLQAYTSGAFVPALMQESDFTKQQLSLATFLLSTVVAVCSPFAGALMDRFGPLRIVAFSVLGEAAAFALLSQIPASFGIYLSCIMLLAFLGAGTTPPGFARMVAARFDRARGLALGTMISGLGLMAITAPMWATWVIGEWGWRTGYLIMAALVACLGGGGLLLVRSEGQLHPIVSKPSAQAAEGVSPLKRPLFWLMLVGFLAPAFFSGGYLFHLITLLRERGFTPTAAAEVQSLVGVAILVGRLGSGTALDRLSPSLVATITFTISALGCLLLLFSNPICMGVAALAIGLTIGAELDIMAYFISRYFGLNRFGRLYGLAYGIFIMSAGASPALITYLVGWGGYSLALAVSTVGTLVGAGILFSLPDPRRIAERQAQAVAQAEPASRLPEPPKVVAALRRQDSV